MAAVVEFNVIVVKVIRDACGLLTGVTFVRDAFVVLTGVAVVFDASGVTVLALHITVSGAVISEP